MEFPAAVHVQGRARATSTTDADPVAVVLDEMDHFGIEQGDARRRARAPRRSRSAPSRSTPTASSARYEVDPNRGMEGVRDLVKAYETFGIKAATAFPAGMTPQVPINDKRFYPIYAKCVELDIPICVTAGVPGPRVPMAVPEDRAARRGVLVLPRAQVRDAPRRRAVGPTLAVKLMLKWPNLYYSTSRVRAALLPADDHRLRQHPRRRQGHVRRLLPDGPVARAHLHGAAQRPVQGRRVAEVPARERGTVFNLEA